MICINITSLLIELVKGDFEKLCIKLYRKNPFCEEEEALEIFYDLFVDIVEDFLRFFTIEDQSDLLQFSKYRSDYKSILLNWKGFLVSHVEIHFHTVYLCDYDVDPGKISLVIVKQ